MDKCAHEVVARASKYEGTFARSLVGKAHLAHPCGVESVTTKEEYGARNGGRSPPENLSSGITLGRAEGSWGILLIKWGYFLIILSNSEVTST